MELSGPSQPDLRLHPRSSGVATHLFAVSFLALLDPMVVLPTVPGSGWSHHDSDHHFQQSDHQRGFQLRSFCRLATLPASLWLFRIPSSYVEALVTKAKTPVDLLRATALVLRVRLDTNVALFFALQKAIFTGSFSPAISTGTSGTRTPLETSYT